MLNWIKRNLVLVAGIVLPVLLVAGFLILQSIPRSLTDPPEYDFLVAAFRYDSQNLQKYNLTFFVQDGYLHGRATAPTDNNPYTNYQNALLYRYQAASNSFTEIPFESPANLNSDEEERTFPIAAVSSLKLDKSSQSPDGFTFEFVGYRGGGGLLGEIFGMRRHYNNNYVLSHGKAWFDLPLPAALSQYYSNDLKFLGWVNPAEINQ